MKSIKLKATDSDAWYYFFGVIPNVDRLYKSFFRKDTSAGCRFFVKENRVLFNDFSAGEVYTIEKAIMAKYGVDYATAMKKLKDVPNQNIKTESTYESEKKEITFTLEDNDNFKYFNRFHIEDSSCRFFGVRSIRRLYINSKLHWRATSDNPIFLYPFTSGKKFYRPLNQSKWLSEGSGIFGLTQLGKGRVVFITSSGKEVMLLHTLGFAAVALPSEGIGKKGSTSYDRLQKLVAVLNSRYDYVFTLFDNDPTGLKSYSLCKDDFSLEGGVTPFKKFKDLTDHSKKFGKKSAYKVIKKIIKNGTKIS